MFFLAFPNHPNGLKNYLFHIQVPDIKHPPLIYHGNECFLSTVLLRTQGIRVFAANPQCKDEGMATFSVKLHQCVCGDNSKGVGNSAQGMTLRLCVRREW